MLLKEIGCNIHNEDIHIYLRSLEKWEQIKNINHLTLLNIYVSYVIL